MDYLRSTETMGLLMESDAYEINACLSGKVLVAGALRLTSGQKTSETSIFYVYTFRDGLISRLETYLDRESAEAAAGTLDLEGDEPS